MKNNKGIAPILIILIIVGVLTIVGGGLYLYKKTQLIKVPEDKTIEKTEKEEVVKTLDLNLTTTKLATIPDNHNIVSRIIFSSDGRKVDYIAEKENKYLVVVNGKEGQSYDEMIIPGPRERGLQFSPDSQIIAYAARNGEKWLMVVNDKEGKQYDEVGVPVFSPDSKQLVYEAREGEKWFIVVNDKEYEQYDGVRIYSFSPDSKQLAYMAEKDKKVFVVVNDKEGKQYDEVGIPVFSPDSQTTVYAAKKGEKWVMVVNDKEEDKLYDNIFLPTFSFDSKQLVYFALKGNRIFVMINGKEKNAYDYWEGNPETFGLVYYSVYYYDNYSIGGDPTTWPPVTFSPNGQKIAYLIVEKEKYTARIPEEGKLIEKEVDVPSIKLVIDGKKYGPAISPIFSPDSQKFAYVSSKRISNFEDFVVVDGKEEKAYEYVWYPVFSPDSKQLAYVARKDENHKFVAVVNGKEGKEYDYILTLKVKFTPDGKHIVYGAQLGNDLWWVVDEVK